MKRNKRKKMLVGIGVAKRSLVGGTVWATTAYGRVGSVSSVVQGYRGGNEDKLRIERKKEVCMGDG